MSERVMKIPEFEYFDMGGKYSGNKRGRNEDDFNYRITPKDDITVQTWYGVNCFELSEQVSEAVFEKTRDGYHAMLDWIEEEFRTWNKSHRLISRMNGTFAIPEKDKFYVVIGKTDEEMSEEEMQFYLDLNHMEPYL